MCKPTSILTPGLLLCVLLSGCATYKSETEQLRSSWAAGNIEGAYAEATSGANDDTESVDIVIWRLEEATAQRYLNNFSESNVVFGQAGEWISRYDSEAEVSLLDETGANFTNQSFLPYTGYYYDRIMMNTYCALNSLQMGNVDEMRVFLNRAYESQENAVYENAADIEKAQEVARQESAKAENSNANDAYNVDRALDDKKFNSEITQHYQYLKDYRVYADYVNPYSVFIDGLFSLTNSMEQNDLERARKNLERVSSMVPGNTYLRQDLQTADQILGGASFEPTTYVIFETGMAPSRDQIRIDIPLFVVTQSVPYVGAAFPQLKFNNNYVSALNVKAAGTSYRTQVVCDMDAVVATEFDNRLPLVITKTLISTGTKALTQWALQEAVKDNSYAYWAVMVTGTIYQAAMNDADLRTWVTLPKQFQYCRLPTPADRKITISAAGTGMTQTIDLVPGTVNLVYVKSNSQ
ncbi:MAG: COG3014 family protein, partial [Puniceicoccales bacterium]